MSLKPQLPREMPSELAQLGQRLLPTSSPYRLIGDTLYTRFHDEEFADLYHREGKPALSPVLLAFVTIFQSLENLSDRKAADAVKIRIDWKYALHLPLDYAGFDASVLCEFRARLIRHEAEGRVFEAVLAQIRAVGLIQQRGIQRTDSLSLLSRARTLGRLELAFETLRTALRALVAAEPEWIAAQLPSEWQDRYRYHWRVERHSADERTKLEQEIGTDGQWLLTLLTTESAPPALKDLPAVQILRTVWEQQFHIVEEHIAFQPPGNYKGKERIQTPYDPEARWAQKRKKGWIGYKLQLTETDDPDLPHLITDIAVTSSLADDRTELNSIAERQQQRQVAPLERYADQGYVCGPTLADADQRGEDLIGPAPKACSPQADRPDGFTHKDFQIDLEQRTAVCPAGHAGTPKRFVGRRDRDRGDHGIVFTFQKRHCDGCALRDRCLSKSRRQRFLTVRADYERLQQARARQQTPEYKAAYRQHRPGVEGCLSAVVRGQGIRNCRYAGIAKNNLRALFIGAAVNLARIAAWQAGMRYRPKRQGLQITKALSLSAGTAGK